MSLGSALWRAVPGGCKVAAANGVAQAAAARPALDFRAAVEEVGGLQRVERKPWVIIGDVREALEAYFGLQTDGLVWEVSRWLSATAGVPSAVGLAHVSGNVYLGPEIRAGSATISPEQVLVANLLSHGEMGLDLLAAPSFPGRETVGLLQEVATFKRMRWVDASKLPEPAGAGGMVNRELGTVIRSATGSVLRRHPLIADVAGVEIEAAALGTCLQHPNYGHLDISGDGLEELQQSLARNSAARSYCPLGGELRLGCAVRTSSGMLFSGYIIGVRASDRGLSPLQSALASLGANGQSFNDIHSVVWTAAVGGECDDALRLQKHDQDMLRTVAPDAAFTVIPMDAE